MAVAVDLQLAQDNRLLLGALLLLSRIQFPIAAQL